MRAKALEFKMPCGKHRRPANASNHDAYGRKPKEHYKRKVPDNERLGSCICDYEDFRTLLEERNTLGDEFKNITKPFKFLALPGEVRNQIYEDLFVFNEAIEFCPESFPYDGGNNTCRSYTPDWHKHYTTNILSYHYTFGQEKLNPVVKFLRVNKQICEEASPYLYSSNEFRFSNCTGWIALDYFLHRVGPKKSAMLENVSVCHPDFLVKPQSINASTSFSEGCIRGDYIGGQVSEPGFYYDKRWFQSQFALTKDPTLVFEKAGKLRRLRLIVPPVKMFRLGTPLRPMVNPTLFDNLAVAFVKLRSAKEAEEEQMTAEEARRALTGTLRTLGKNVRVEVCDVDELGRYPLMVALQESLKEREVPGDGKMQAIQASEQDGDPEDVDGGKDETEQDAVEGRTQDVDESATDEEGSEKQD